MVAELPCLFELLEELECRRGVVVEVSEILGRYPLQMLSLTCGEDEKGVVDK